MSLQTAAGPINAEDADNFEEIEKQFAVKGGYSTKDIWWWRVVVVVSS